MPLLARQPRQRRASVAVFLALTATLLVISQSACQQASPDPASQGKQLASELGCTSCHSINNTKSVGPTWKGLHGSEVRLVGGATAFADDAFLAEKLTNPAAKVVDGYPSGVMTAAIQPHKETLGRKQNADAIVAYIRSLK